MNLEKVVNVLLLVVIVAILYSLFTIEKYDCKIPRNRVCTPSVPYITSALLSEPNQCAGCLGMCTSSADYAECVANNACQMVSGDIDFKNQPYVQKEVLRACNSIYAPDGTKDTDICKEAMN